MGAFFESEIDSVWAGLGVIVTLRLDLVVPLTGRRSLYRMSVSFTSVSVVCINPQILFVIRCRG